MAGQQSHTQPSDQTPGDRGYSQGNGQLRLRGLAGAQGEWLLHAHCHNLRKLRNDTSAAIAPA